MSYLVHHGIKGQKWGIRRYQNKDGTLTTLGKQRAYEKRNPASKYLRDGKFTDEARNLMETKYDQWLRQQSRDKIYTAEQAWLLDGGYGNAESEQYEALLRKVGIDPVHDKARGVIDEELYKYYIGRPMRSISNKDRARMQDAGLKFKLESGILNLALKELPEEIHDDVFAYLYANIDPFT